MYLNWIKLIALYCPYRVMQCEYVIEFDFTYNGKEKYIYVGSME